MFNIFKSKPKTTPEQVFWKFFQTRMAKTAALLDANTFHESPIYEDLTTEIKKVHETLFPEFYKDQETGQYVFVITPDGIKDGINAVEKLAAAAPDMPNWRVQKFRHWRDGIAIHMGDRQFDQESIRVFPKLEGEKVHVVLYVQGLNLAPDQFKHLTFLLLDHSIGEYNTMTRVGYIDFVDWNDTTDVSQTISLKELREMIEKELY